MVELLPKDSFLPSILSDLLNNTDTTETIKNEIDIILSNM